MGHDGVSEDPPKTLSDRFRDILQPFAEVEEPTVEWMFADISLVGASSVVGRGLAQMNHLNWSQELSLEQAAKALGKVPESDSSRPVVLRVQKGHRESPRQYDYKDARTAANACHAKSFGGILPDEAGPNDDIAQWMWADASVVGHSGVGSGLARMSALNWSRPRRIADVILELSSYSSNKAPLSFAASPSRPLRVHVRTAAGVVEDLEFASPSLAAADLARFLPSVPCGRPAICQLTSPKYVPPSPLVEDSSGSAVQVRWRLDGAAAQEDDDDDGFEDEETPPARKAPAPLATWSAATGVAEAIAELERRSGEFSGRPITVRLSGGQAARGETSYPNVTEAVAELRKHLPAPPRPRPSPEVAPPARPSPSPEVAAATSSVAAAALSAAAPPPEPLARTPSLPPLPRSAVASSPELAPIQSSVSLAEAAKVPPEAIAREDDGYGFEDDEGFEEDT